MSTVLTVNSLTRRAYTGNILYKDGSYRNNKTGHDLISADQKAMLRALDRLDTLDFDSSDETDTKSIYNTVTSYVNVYNNAVSSSTNADNSNVARIGKQMRALMKEYSDELSDIGISIGSDGTAKINTTELKKATTRQVSKVFGSDDYKNDMRALMKKLRNQVNRYMSGGSSSSTTTIKKTAADSEASAGETDGSTLNLYV